MTFTPPAAEDASGKNASAKPVSADASAWTSALLPCGAVQIGAEDCEEHATTDAKKVTTSLRTSHLDERMAVEARNRHAAVGSDSFF